MVWATRTETVRRTTVREVAGAFLVYLLVSIWWLWPLPASVATHLPDLDAGNPLVAADLHLIVWALGWGSHALVTDPLHLFDANSFHPAPNTLAYSEHALGYVPVFAPVYWMSGNPALAANVTLLVLFPLRGAALYLLARRFAPPPAAFVAGLLYGFAPEARMDLMKFHVHGTFYLPLALFFTERWLSAARARDAVLLAVALALQAATSFYLAFAQVFGYAAYLATAVTASWRALDRRRIAGLVAVAGVLAAWTVVLGLPYLSLRESGVVPDYADGAQRPLGLRPGIASRQVWGYLRAGGIGLVGYALVLAAFVPPLRARMRWLAIGAVVTLVGLVVSSGPEPFVWGVAVWTPYPLFQEWLPGFSTVRLPSRFAEVSHLGLCLLAAAGAARLFGRPSARAAWAASAGLSVLALIGMAPRDLPIAPHALGAATPPVYAWLARHGEGRPLLEVPRPSWPDAARRMLGSTAHWLPIVDGYSGHALETDDFLHQLASGLPSERSLESLLSIVDLGWILVHTGELPPSLAKAWRRAPPAGLERVGAFGADLLFRVERVPRVDRRHLLLSSTHTLGGLPRTLLDAPCPGRIRIRMRSPLPWKAGSVAPFSLVVTNDGTEAWPAAGLLPNNLVRVRVCIDRGDAACSEPPTRLDGDVPPGGSALARPLVRTPHVPGGYVLTAELVQVGGESLRACGLEPVRVPVEIVAR